MKCGFDFIIIIISLYSDAVRSIMGSVNYGNHRTQSCIQSNPVRPDFNHFFLAVDCGPLSVPMNGSSSGNITVFPNNVQFNCDPGFIVHGSVIRTCQANGTWSGFQTLCTGMLKANMGENALNRQASYLNTSITKATATFVLLHALLNVTSDR